MKIGVLTVPFNNNYGGFLQAYALKMVLTKMGHDVVFINRRRNRPKRLRFFVRQFFLACHLMKDRNAQMIEKISVNTNLFKFHYLEPISQEYYSKRQLKKCLKLGINCFVVGSDQVWRYRYAQDSIDDFFCNFLWHTGIPRISYAASMGTNTIEYPEYKRKICARLLSEFSAVSVRESTSADLLRKYFGAKDVEVVLDPTLLHGQQLYIDLFKEKYPKPEHDYIFTYILDDNIELRNAINDFANKKKIAIVDMKAQTGNINLLNPLPPVEQWLYSIYYSKYVVTDSFHGTVFSILFQKPFYCFGNEERGLVRFESLLDMLGLNDKLSNDTGRLEEILTKDICWDRVNCKIHQEQERSFSFLNNALSICQK